MLIIWGVATRDSSRLTPTHSCWLVACKSSVFLSHHGNQSRVMDTLQESRQSSYINEKTMLQIFQWHKTSFQRWQLAMFHSALTKLSLASCRCSNHHDKFAPELTHDLITNFNEDSFISMYYEDFKAWFTKDVPLDLEHHYQMNNKNVYLCCM